MTRPCVTHHHACDCREALFTKIRERGERLEQLLIEVEPHLDEWNFPLTLKDRVREALGLEV